MEFPLYKKVPGQFFKLMCVNSEKPNSIISIRDDERVSAIGVSENLPDDYLEWFYASPEDSNEQEFETQRITVLEKILRLRPEILDKEPAGYSI
jgi:hypothetical protein